MSEESVTVESLELEVQSSSQSAVSGLEALVSSLNKVRASVKGGIGLTSVVNQLNKMNTALNGVSGDNAGKLDKLANSLSKLQGLGNLKISASIGNQLKNIGTAADSLKDADFSGITKLSDAVGSLSGMGNASGLKSTITQLQRVPQLTEAFKNVDMTAFAQKTQQLSTALEPLAGQLNTVSTAFSRMPENIKQTVQATNMVAPANDKTKKSYAELATKIGAAYITLKKAANTISSWTKGSMDYVEDLNLFTASMGEYASKAKDFAENVGELMGIDPAEWMRNQGVFNTMIEGFGAASDRAYTMSQNLTQLGYDISSFFNISVGDAMSKLQSGIAGELEPLRRLGYDLSVARLQQEAYALGIEKNVSAMTQAEKAELRYYAIMTQVTTAQGDMARTLEAPANQLRILQAQVTQAGRALGNIFIPAITKGLPYAIAFFEVIRSIADIIANLVGFELPEIDYSGLESVSSSASDLSDGLADADAEAKKIKRTLMGFDELNILSSNDSMDSDLDEILGGSLGIELPTYDFIGSAVSSKVKAITDGLKEWLGITDEINSWSDLFNTRLGTILTTVGVIGGAFLAWKLVGLVSQIGEFLGGVKSATGALGKFKKAGLVAIGGFAEVALVNDGVKKLALGVGDVNANILEIVTGAGIGAAAMYAAFGPVGLAFAAVVGLAGAIKGVIDAEYEMAKTEYYDKQGAAIEDVRDALKGYFDAMDFDKLSEWTRMIEDAEQSYKNAGEAYDNMWNSIADKPVFDASDIEGLTTAVEALADAAIALNNAKIGSIMESIKSSIENNITPALTGRLSDLNDKLNTTMGLLDMKISDLSSEYRNILSEIQLNGGNVSDDQKERLQEIRQEISTFTLSDDASTERWKLEIEDALTGAIKAGTDKDSILQNVQDLMSDRDVYLDSLKEKYAADMNTLQQLIDLDNTEFGGQLGFTSEDLRTLKDSYEAQMEEVREKYNEVLDQIIATYSQGTLNYDFYNFWNDVPVIGGAMNFLEDAYYGAFGWLPFDIGAPGQTGWEYVTNKNMSKEEKELLEELLKYKIPGYASGGYPDNGSLFIANEAGPELVGTLDGRTAVVNNSQIEEALYRAVAQGMADGMASSGSNTNDGEIHVYVELDGDIIAEAVARKNEIRSRRFNGR